MLPGQSAKSGKSGPSAEPKQYGPNAGNHAKHKRKAKSDSSTLQSSSPALYNDEARAQLSDRPMNTSDHTSSAWALPSSRQQLNAQDRRQSADPEGGLHAQQGSDRGTRPAGTCAGIGSGLAESAEEVMIQEDEVEWGDEGGGGHPALQHAMAAIRAKGETGWGSDCTWSSHTSLLRLVYPALESATHLLQLATEHTVFPSKAVNTPDNQTQLRTRQLVVSCAHESRPCCNQLGHWLRSLRVLKELFWPSAA